MNRKVKIICETCDETEIVMFTSSNTDTLDLPNTIQCNRCKTSQQEDHERFDVEYKLVFHGAHKKMLDIDNVNDLMYDNCLDDCSQAGLFVRYTLDMLNFDKSTEEL